MYERHAANRKYQKDQVRLSSEEVDMMTRFSNLEDVRVTKERNGSVKRARERVNNVYGHTTLKAPVLVRSPKLSNVGPG